MVSFRHTSARQGKAHEGCQQQGSRSQEQTSPRGHPKCSVWCHQLAKGLLTLQAYKLRAIIVDRCSNSTAAGQILHARDGGETGGLLGQGLVLSIADLRRAEKQEGISTKGTCWPHSALICPWLHPLPCSAPTFPFSSPHSLFMGINNQVGSN